MNAPSKLAVYLDKLFPIGVAYEDLVIVCLRIYCNTDGLPKEVVAAVLDKERIAESFAWLAKKREFEDYPLLSSAYGANFHKVSDKGHWLEVIAWLFKKSEEFDRARASKIIEGFEIN